MIDNAPEDAVNTEGKASSSDKPEEVQNDTLFVGNVWRDTTGTEEADQYAEITDEATRTLGSHEMSCYQKQSAREKAWEAMGEETDTYPAEADDEENIIGNADPSRLPAKVYLKLPSV